jgi:hypothetical protein
MLFFGKEISQNDKTCHKKKSLAKERERYEYMYTIILITTEIPKAKKVENFFYL